MDLSNILCFEQIAIPEMVNSPAGREDITTIIRKLDDFLLGKWFRRCMVSCRNVREHMEWPLILRRRWYCLVNLRLAAVQQVISGGGLTKLIGFG